MSISEIPISKKISWAAKNLKNVIFLVVFSGGALTFVLGWRFYDKTEIDTQHQATHDLISGVVDRFDVHVEKNADDFEILTTTIGQIQTVQRKSYARDEARRVTGHIRDRDKRERQYDFIVEKNMFRLENKLDTCSDTRCR